MPRQQNVVHDSLTGESAPFRWMIEHLGEVVGVLDPEGKLVYVSPALEALAGYRPDELVGTDPLDHVHPGDHSAVTAAIALAFATPGASPSVEFRYRHKDGSWRDVHATGTLMPLGKGEDGAGLMFVAQDVTERKRCDEARRLLARIVECSEDAIVTTDLEGTVLTWNPSAQRLFGFRAEEIVGTPALPLVPAELAEDARRLAERAREGEVFQDVETERLRKDGARVPVSLTTFAIRDEDGRPLGIVAVARDRGERVRAAQALEGQATLRALFRRTLREGHASMRATGRRLADDVRAETMDGFVAAFADLGLGHLEVVERHPHRHAIAGRDLLETTPGAGRPTCSLPLGYLERAAALLSGGEGLGTELACQSLGAERCLFVVRGRPVTRPDAP